MPLYHPGSHQLAQGNLGEAFLDLATSQSLSTNQRLNGAHYAEV
jgi:hypothetical protein